MTREATMEVKKDDTASNRTSSSSYSDDDEESQETEVSDASDLSSDSEQSEFDKNNNRSPPPTQKFLQELDCNNLYLHSKRNINMAMSQGNREEELVRQSYDATSSEEYFSNDGEEYRYSTSRFLEDEVFVQSRHDQLTARYSKDPFPSLRHINANENNNSNRKRFRNMSSASYDFRNPQTFRNKTRSVQLSSVRASKGKYKSNRMIPYKERMICKNGESNVRLKKFGKLDSATRYSKDIFTTLIDLHWTWVILLTALVYIGHWVIFGVIYWIFAFVNDDFTKIFGDVSDGLAENATNAALEDQQPCVSGVYDFVSAFLFSMESETTIGYGSRTIGTSCKGAIAVLVIQCVISAIFDTWVIGMCFSRMARPDARCETIMYSKNAVICTRDGKKCLIVRVGNLRKSLLLGVSCRARIITLRAPHCKEEEEGHEFMLEQKELDFENANITTLTAPVEYCHVIDKDSPLYSIPARYISSDTQNWFEVVIILTGIVEATGMTMHAQTSYLNTEIKYRHRLVPVISPSENKDRYIVDFNKFHETEPEDPSIAKNTRRNKNLGLFDGRFDALVEESDEYSDVFPASDNSENRCKLCGKCTSGDNNMNPACECKGEIKHTRETEA